MKILHLADTHIGPFPGPVVDGKNARAEDTLRCFDELIDKAATLRPDMIVHAGDLFHAAKTWSERGIGEVNEASPVGAVGVVVERIPGGRETGRVETDDRMSWTALSADGNPLEVGDKVNVVGQESIKLIVERI